METGYTGKPYDAVTGLSDYGFRDYSPAYARFITEDPIRDGENWFAYVGNNPVNWIDPDGLKYDEGEPSEAYRRKIDYERNKIVGVPGYPETGSTVWRGWNDKAFTEAADEYNQKYGYKPGDEGYRSRESIKAQSMIESGSSKHKEVFLHDPLQANNWGDYDPDGKKLKVAGLTRGEEMNPKKSAKAALEWWRYKGTLHDTSGAEISWKGDRIAYRDYNGNNNPKYGRKHKEWYTDTVMDLTQKMEAKAKEKKKNK